jgi:hypothetical protein
MKCSREACTRSAFAVALLGRRRKGVWFEDAWYCSTSCIEQEARERIEAASEPLIAPGRVQKASRLGALLLHQRSVTAATLDDALRLQRDSGLRLGAQLRAMGAVSRVDVLRALSAQSGIGYLATLDPATVAHGPGSLSRDAVRALGVVPVDADPERRRLKAACAAPLPRLALAVLRELTGATVDPLLVDDDLLAELIASYGAAVEGARVPVTRTRSVGEASQRIAEAVRDGRAQRMQQVRCEPWLWVRLEGEQAPEEIVVPIDAVRRDREWLADRMPL